MLTTAGEAALGTLERAVLVGEGSEPIHKLFLTKLTQIPQLHRLPDLGAVLRRTWGQGAGDGSHLSTAEMGSLPRNIGTAEPPTHCPESNFFLQLTRELWLNEFP